jgi:hypothetical protein
MKRKMSWKLHLPLVIGVLIVLATITSVSKPGPAGEDIIKEIKDPCTPTQDSVTSTVSGRAVDGSGVTGGAELRTPEDMERAEHGVPDFRGQVPPRPGPTEENYWEKKEEANALREKATAQDKASALEEEKSSMKKSPDPCQGSQ